MAAPAIQATVAAIIHHRASPRGPPARLPPVLHAALHIMWVQWTLILAHELVRID